MRTFIKILVLLCFSTTLSFGQVIDVTDLYSSNKFFFPNFEHLGEHTGLPHYRISSLIEDHEGYLWIGTNDGGLIKYDGYSFHSFEFDPTDQFSISSNNVYFVFEDSRKMLWVGTENALCYYHPYRQQFMKVQLQSADKSLIVPSDISCITEDKFGNLLLGTNLGIITITHINEENFLLQKSHEIFLSSVEAVAIPIKFHNEFRSTPGMTIQDMEFDPKGLLWVLTKIELGVIDYPHDSLPTNSLKLASKGFGNYKRVAEISSAREINIDGSGIVRVVSGESLYHIIHNRDTIEVKNIDYRSNIRKIEDFYKGYSSGRKFWIGFYRTDVKLYNDENSEFYPMTFETNDIRDLYDNGVTCLLKTRSNVIFIGTSWGGLFKFNQNSILSYFHPKLQNIHLKQTNNLRYVYEDSKGYLWIIAKDIYKCNRNTGEILETYTDGFFNQLWCYKNKLIEHSNGDIWIGTEGSGLIYIDFNKNGEAVGSMKVFSDTTVTSLSEDANGMVWVGTNIYDMNNSRVSSELFKINPAGKITNKHMIAQWKQRSDMQIDQFINQVNIDKKGLIWLATGFGLVKVSENPDKITRYLLPENSSATLGQSKILSVCPDPNFPDRYLWIGTSGGGLYSFDIERSSFIHTLETQGILSNHIASILSDDYGNLWLGTDMGLVKLVIDKDGGTVIDIQRFNNYDGLITNDYSNYYGHNAVKTINGELIFTGPRGFHIIDPQNVKTDSYIPPIHITNFYINHKPANYNLPGSPLDKPISMVKSIQLPHDKNTVEFEFTALDYKSPNNLKYAFILEHYDKDWIYYGTNRTIQYTKLPPGKYTLKVKVANRDGIWSNSFSGLDIHIYKPWWATFWAYVLYFVITGFVIWSIIRGQINRQKMKMKMEMKILEANKFKELDSMKSMFFANISHEFRTPLTLIMSPIENLLNKVSDTSIRNSLLLMQRNASLLQQYINEILDLSKLEANKLSLNTRELDIVKYIKFLQSSFESQAKQKGISLHFASVREKIMCYFDPERVNSIFTNLLSNAIKYTPANGRVDVNLEVNFGIQHPNFSPSEGCVEISVKNTGDGIPKEKLPYIFDRYYRVDNELTEKEMGTGLGLTLVRELVHLHKGIVNVMSKENEFTVFIVRLPLGHHHLKPEEIDSAEANEMGDVIQKTESTKIKTEETKNGEDSNPDRKIVLVIEDSEDMRTLIRFGLLEDYKVIEAQDGEEGEMMAIETCPDLIICDVSMPKKEGFEVAANLKKNEITSHIPIVLLTGRASQSDKITGLETGVDAYLTKPFHTKELKIRVNKLLEQREKLKEKYSRQNILKLNSIREKSINQVFLEKVIKVIETHLAEEDFNVHMLMKEMHVSRTQLHRKLKALLNQSANELIHSIRMQKASEMLKNKSATIAEIAYLVGFSSPPYFSRTFKQYFGHSPSEHIQSHS